MFSRKDSVMSFELFQSTGTRNKAFISVTENKAFGLSRAFIDKYGITKNHKAVILYDEENNKVALHFSLNNPKFGFAVRINNERHGGIVVARSFFDLKSIDCQKYANRYDEFVDTTLKDIGIPDKDGQVFVISLKEKIVPEKKILQNLSSESDLTDLEDEPINLDDIPF